MTLQEEIVFDEYFRCYAIGRKHVHIMRYDPRRPHHERYVKGGAPIDPAMLERVRSDSLKLMNALGYDFCTLEFAVRDGDPVRDRLPEPGARRGRRVRRPGELRVGRRARDRSGSSSASQQPADPLTDYRWQRFLDGDDTVEPPKKSNGRTKKPAAPRAPGSAPRGPRREA